METNRLILRRFTPSDLNYLFLLLSDEQVMHFSVSGPLSLEKTKLFLEGRILKHYSENGFGLMALFDKHTMSFVGFAGLITQTIESKSCVELAFRLFPTYWGKGLAFEASCPFLEYARQNGLSEVISIIDPLNERSLALIKRLEFTYWKDTLFHGQKVQIFQKGLV